MRHGGGFLQEFRIHVKKHRHRAEHDDVHRASAAALDGDAVRIDDDALRMLLDFGDDGKTTSNAAFRALSLVTIHSSSRSSAKTTHCRASTTAAVHGSIRRSSRALRPHVLHGFMKSQAAAFSSSPISARRIFSIPNSLNELTIYPPPTIGQAAFWRSFTHTASITPTRKLSISSSMTD